MCVCTHVCKCVCVERERGRENTEGRVPDYFKKHNVMSISSLREIPRELPECRERGGVLRQKPLAFPKPTDALNFKHRIFIRI